MNYNSDEILNTLALEVFGRMNFVELTQRLAHFFVHYMPVTGVAAYVAYDEKIVKISEFRLSDEVETPNEIKPGKELWERVFCGQPRFGSVFNIQAQTSNGEYGELFDLIYSGSVTSISIPLKYNKCRTMYLTIYAPGEDCYTADHVNLCRKLQPALVFAVANMESRQHFDLLDSTSLELLVRACREGRAPGTENEGLGRGFLTLDEYVVAYIEKVLRHTKGKVAGKNGAAALLGMHVSTLWSKIRKFHIKVPRD